LVSSGRGHTRFDCDWSSDVCSSDLDIVVDSMIVDSDLVLMLCSPKILLIALETLPESTIIESTTISLASGSTPKCETCISPLERSEERRVGKEYRSLRACTPLRTLL